MSCGWYTFYCGDYHCLKMDKDVSDTTYHRYCRDYSYDECPLYKEDRSYYYEEVGKPLMKDSGGGGCYITTACVISKGLSDDCYELETLRHYRDTWLMKNEEGLSAITQYYSIAPKIIAAIDCLSNSKEIYSMIYEKMVLPCIRLIEEEKYQETLELYRNMTFELEAEYCE